MTKLMKEMMLSCHKATELIEKKIQFGLSFHEKMSLFFHKSMCDACNIYEKQSKWIDKLVFKNNFLKNDKEISLKENNELKKRIISEIDNK